MKRLLVIAFPLLMPVLALAGTASDPASPVPAVPPPVAPSVPADVLAAISELTSVVGSGDVQVVPPNVLTSEGKAELLAMLDRIIANPSGLQGKIDPRQLADLRARIASIPVRSSAKAN